MLAVAVLACGSPHAAGTTDTSARPAAHGQSAPIEPCKLLTDDQVRTVVPDLKGSFVAANGESLTKGIESYQCSYVNERAQGLMVILTIAVDDDHFKQIKGSSSSHADAQKVDVGDVGWLSAKDGGLNVTVHKKRTVIDLTLNTQDAPQKSKGLTELARAVAAKVS
jgi:hypothetical protein